MKMRKYITKKERAWINFYPEGNGHAKPGYVLHHKDPKLFENEPARYSEWRIEDLEMLTKDEHTRLHQQRKEAQQFNRGIYEEDSQAERKYWKDAYTHILN